MESSCVFVQSQFEMMNAEVCDHLSQVDIEGIANTALAPLVSEKIDCAVNVCNYKFDTGSLMNATDDDYCAQFQESFV